MPRQRGEQRGRRDAVPVVVGDPPRLLRVPDRAAGGDVGALVDASRRAASGVELAREPARGHGDVAEHRHRDRVEAAERVGIGVDLHDRLVRRDAGVVRERRAEHDQQVGLVHEPRRDRRAAAAEHAARERVIVGDDALGLERRGDRRVQALGELQRRRRCRRGRRGRRRSPDARAPASSATARSTAPSGGRDRGIGEPAARRSDARRVAGRQAPAPRRAARGARRRAARARACTRGSSARRGRSRAARSAWRPRRRRTRR